MRLGIGLGAIAAATVMIGGMVRFPTAVPTTTTGDALAMDVPAAAAPEAPTVKRVRYVLLQPGQVPPPGARVIDAVPSTPGVAVTRIARPASVRTVTQTRQSGRG